MRIHKRFTAPDLCQTAETAETGAYKYLTGLVAAGVVRVEQERQLGVAGSWRVYRLIRDLGPKAPILYSDGTVFDPNARQPDAPAPAPKGAGRGAQEGQQ